LVLCVQSFHYCCPIIRCYSIWIFNCHPKQLSQVVHISLRQL
jgi:hypothetical protein